MAGRGRAPPGRPGRGSSALYHRSPNRSSHSDQRLIKQNSRTTRDALWAQNRLYHPPPTPRNGTLYVRRSPSDRMPRRMRSITASTAPSRSELILGISDSKARRAPIRMSSEISSVG